MEEKIQWYQEVLQLEPNSKLFFPLAVLLSQAQRIPEALQVLQNGLSRHDEYLEARLFYIELLYKTGKSEEIAPELQKLQDLFSHYTGFWQAWAAFIASNGSSMDTSALMRFLSLYFTHKDLSLHTVIDKGLQALMQEESMTSSPTQEAPKAFEEKAPLEADPQQALADEPELPLEPCQELPTQAVIPEETMADASLAEESLEAQAHVLQAEEGVECAQALEGKIQEDVAQGLIQDQASEQIANLDAQAQELSLQDALASEAKPESQGDLQQDLQKDLQGELSPQPTPVSSEPSAPELSQEMASQPQTLSPLTMTDEPMVFADAELGEAGLVERESELASSASESSDEPDAELPEEPISLRTRSMAEVLAEQGDIKGALDIYYELEGAASSVEESADLRQRITTLRSLLAPPKDSSQAEAKPDKSRVISLIEALSERLEARAQQ